MASKNGKPAAKKATKKVSPKKKDAKKAPVVVNNVVKVNEVKDKTLRKRMLKWFK